VTRLLVVGGRKAGQCRTTGQLETRGYALARIPALPLPNPLDPVDVIIFALPGSEADRVADVCARLGRLGGPLTLVLADTADPNEAARTLEAGADDCLLAPHNPREVVARVRALLRRRDRNLARGPATRFEFDGHRLDAVNLLVRAPNGAEVGITSLQHRLLTALLAHPGEVVSREHLLAQVLGEDSDSFDRAIDVHVSRLKKRLAQVSGAELITAYRGVGYRLEVQQVTP
jgi:two-component system OmpR family response regulator